MGKALKKSLPRSGQSNAAEATPVQPPIFRLSAEVLREIFRFLDKCSCSRVARSCKRFKEPALDELWRDIATLAAPLALLDELVDTNDGRMFRNGLGRADWPNYWSYAERVRGVHIRGQQPAREGQIKLDPHSIVHAVAVATSQAAYGALLPKATTLTLDFQQPPGPVLLLQLISPAVRRITITMPESLKQAAAMVFSTLTSMSCSFKLERFEVTIGNREWSGMTSTQDRSTMLESNLATFASSQPTLQSLRMHSIDSLSSLKEAIHPLRCLRALDVTYSRVGSSDPPLKDIITSLGSCTDLEKLQIRGTSSLGQHSFALIQPLLSCRRLVDLDFSWVGRITLDTANVKEMGKAWTKLESLRFLLAGNGMPVGLLLAFSTSFSPSLRSLTIPLDVSTVAYLAPIKTEVPSHSLKELTIDSSMKETHVQQFAELLGTIFQPGFRLYFERGSGYQKGNRESICDKVNSLLSLIWRVQDRARQKLQNELGAGVST